VLYEWLFWLSLALAAYTFVGYPALALLLARRYGCAPKLAAGTPPVTVVIAMRDEAERIGERIRNLQACDYPADRLKILLVDDGSCDGCAEVALAHAVLDPRIKVLRLGKARGKAVALNAAMREVDTDLTIFADARQRFGRGALRALVAPFADPNIGVVAGELLLSHDSESENAATSHGAYWRLERALRHAEARLGWAHAASGSIYAIRTQLFRPLPAGLVLDDVYTPAQIVQRGARVWVAREAQAFEPAGTGGSGWHEFRRKLRTLTGNWQLIAALPWLLSPRRNPVFFAWCSHKFARLLAPWALLLALVGAAGAPGGLAQLALWPQVALYLVALAALLFPHGLRRMPLASTAASFVSLNFAALLSLPLYLGRADLSTLWKR